MAAYFFKKLRGRRRRDKSEAKETNTENGRNINSGQQIIPETSAGGVVVRRVEGKLHVALLETRHSRGEVWVLPKGHLKHGMGESLSEAAVRESKEELGIEYLRLKRFLGKTRYRFKTERGIVDKTVHYYLMEGLSDKLTPQKEEGFSRARWVPLKKALKIITYPTDKKIIKKVLSKKDKKRRGS